MILLSRLIKSRWSNLENQENKVITIKSFHVETDNNDMELVNHRVFAERDAILAQAREEAAAIVNEAKHYKESVDASLAEERRAWEQEVIQLSNQAKQNGYEAGLIEGREHGYTEMLQLIEQAKQTVDSSKLDYRKKIEDSEQTILALGLKVATKILGTHLDGNSEHFITVVKRALKEAREYREVQLHIHPMHYEFILSQKEDLSKIFPKETELYIYPDGELSEQSCIIESANGRIDASVDQQLEEIKTKLFELLESE